MKKEKNMKKITLTLETPEIGNNEYWDQFDELSNFVSENWKVLYEGACRLGINIEADDYAPQRIQINNTRLHGHIGLKYADGFKYNSDSSPTDNTIINTVRDLNTLIREAKKEIRSSITLVNI